MIVSQLILDGSIKELADGKAEYDKLCVYCHGASGTGDGKIVEHMGIAPSDLTVLKANDQCVTQAVMKAVLGRHAADDAKKMKMPALADNLTTEQIYLISQYISSIQN